MLKFGDVRNQLMKWLPCEDAWLWLIHQSSVNVAWQICDRPDWMLWVLKELPLSQPRLDRCVDEIMPLKSGKQSKIRVAIAYTYHASKKEAREYLKIIRTYYPDIEEIWPLEWRRERRRG